MSAELDGHRQVHLCGCAVEQRRAVLPLLHGIECGAMKKRRPGQDLYFGDVTRGVDEGVERNVAGNALRFGDLRIDRWNRFDELRGLYVATDGKRSGRTFAVRSRDQGVGAGVLSGCIDERNRLARSAGLAGSAHNRSGQMDLAERRLFRRLWFGRSVAGCGRVVTSWFHGSRWRSRRSGIASWRGSRVN